MNYYGARELKNADGIPSGKWHYTVMNDGRIYPVGNCADGCPGHDTREGAYEHQRQYELERVQYDGKITGQLLPCQVCGAWTDRFASWGVGSGGMEMVMLCDEHRDREHMEAFVKPGDAISSF